MSEAHLEIIDRVGEGDLFEIFLARLCTASGKHLVSARRLLRQTVSAPECLTALQAASVQARRMQHPRLLSHLGFFQAGEDHFWVSERPEGYDLSAVSNRLLSREVRISPIRSLQMGLDFLEGLEALHLAGESHGGLEPANLVVDFEGVTRLDGIGLERALLAVKALKQKTRRGRGDFLAPEVMQGRNPSPASDVFSAAAVLYLLLTGNPPFGRKERSGVQSAVRHVAIQPPSKVERSLPFTCDAVFLRALNLSPSQRHENAAALRGALASLRAAMLHGPDEGRDGVREFLDAVFPNEALIPGRRGTGQRPAQGAPIPLSGEVTFSASEEEKVPTATERSPVSEAKPRVSPAQPEPAFPAPVSSPTPPAPPGTAPTPDEPWLDATPIAAPPAPAGESEPITAVGMRPAVEPPWTVEKPALDEAPDPAAAPVVEAHEDTDEVAPVPAPQRPVGQTSRASPEAPGATRVDWRRGIIVLLSLAVLGLVGVLLFGTGRNEPERQETPLAFLTVEASQPVLLLLDDELLSGDHPARHRLLRIGEHRLTVKTPEGVPILDQTFTINPGEHRVVAIPAYAVPPPRVQPKPPEKAPDVPPPPKPKPPVRKPPRKRSGGR
ncbi:MAG: protein kinase [Myxococcales bacterium]|nr:protein kinase [Myxococcales bacterium]